MLPTIQISGEAVSRLEALLGEARRLGCSDVHLSQGLPVTFRLHGVLRPRADSPEDGLVREMILSLLPEGLPEEDADFALERPGLGRMRVNVYRHRLGLAAAIRLLQETIPTLEGLGLPPVLGQLASRVNGLVLVTGPTGSGKSTTLAAMIDAIARSRATHILTVEDPVEYVFPQHRAMVHQREVGTMVGSFAAALRSALREDPDVILVGEMRDYETISTAVTAAETGHLVLSTLHTTGAASTIDRIVDTCPPQAQSQMRSQLSMILRGMVTQQLLPLADGSGRVVATEILIGTDAVSNIIRENKAHQLGTVMQSGAALGMHTMNSDLARLVRTRRISVETAMDASPDRKDLQQFIG